MKLIIALSFLFLGIFVSVSVMGEVPKTTENRAIIIKFFGGITGFDANAYKVMRTSMAALVAEGSVDQFITRAWGYEGGAEICLELNPDPSLTLDNIIKMLAVIKPDSRTIFNYQPVINCAALSE